MAEQYLLKPCEWLPLVDEAGKVCGKAARRDCHAGTKLLHPVIHLHVFNSSGELYLQKRPLHKDTQPGKWDTAVGGHVDCGEAIIDALRREALEELGIADFRPDFIDRYVFESSVEKELVNVFRTLYDRPLYPDPDELDGGRFWTFTEIEAQFGKGIFTPNFESDFRKFFSNQSAGDRV